MNLAKISANGQITVPVEIRRKLNLKEGDKILFFERDDGEVVIDNASTQKIDDEKSGKKKKAIYSIGIDMTGYRFNRDEANER